MKKCLIGSLSLALVLSTTSNVEAKTYEQMKAEAYKNRQRICVETLPKFQEIFRDFTRDVVYRDFDYQLYKSGTEYYVSSNSEEGKYKEEEQKAYDIIYNRIIQEKVFGDESEEVTRENVISLIQTRSSYQLDSLYQKYPKLRDILFSYIDVLSEQVRTRADEDVDFIVNQYEFSTKAQGEAPSKLVSGYEENFKYKDAACLVYAIN